MAPDWFRTEHWAERGTVSTPRHPVVTVSFHTHVLGKVPVLSIRASASGSEKNPIRSSPITQRTADAL